MEWWLIRPHGTVEGAGSALLPSSGTKWGSHSYSRIFSQITSNLTEKRDDGRRLPRGSRRRRGKPARRRFQGALGVVMPWLGAWSIIVPSQAFRFQANHHHHHHASVVTVVDSASLDFGKISWACSCPKQKRWGAKAVELWLCDWETYHAKRAQFKVQSQSFIRMFHMYAIKKRSFVRMHMTRSTDLCANIPLINS